MLIFFFSASLAASQRRRHAAMSYADYYSARLMPITLLLHARIIFAAVLICFDLQRDAAMPFNAFCCSSCLF